MRELFDEGAVQAARDPRESARQSARPPQRKRFYKEAGVTEAEGGFAITLDGKPIRTPSRRQVVIPSRELADAVAAEWAAQGETIDPMTMPLTRVANSVVEGVLDRVDLVSDDLAKYFESDLLFYRAGHPEGLVAREAAHWDPVLFWAAEALGAHFILSEGVMHVKQPDEALQAARAALPGDAWSVAALHVVTTLTGSALLALALAHGARDTGQVWAAAHVDEDWNIEQWGLDEEAASRRATRLRDFEAAVAVLAAVKASGAEGP
ncbi:ATP12 family protein [Bradyrhizobium sp. MOS003]|uniref:ATP12 family chaperone protein n=1 Tax=Bradyrhizobium sp. MOS003 TaxID=2133946 RepID=UPI000D116CF0|nr:ATP12 family protein [Bradyrhizobium sp. MOS003]PSO14377.1 ATPase [Bradyrhizobium sp. MOS003]